MSENLRVKSSQYIDETTRVSFKFNGTTTAPAVMQQDRKKWET